MSETPDISTLRLSPEQWGFIKGEEEKRTKIAAEQARDAMQFQAKALKAMEEQNTYKTDGLRDMFAAQALLGLGTWIPLESKAPYYHQPDLKSDEAITARAVWAYRQADAMLRAREV